MVVSDSDRRMMHAGLVQALGVEVADVVMEHLPPVGWADLASKSDLNSSLAALRSELRGDMERGMRALGTSFGKDMAAQTRAFIIAMAGMVAAVVGSMVGAVATLAH